MICPFFVSVEHRRKEANVRSIKRQEGTSGALAGGSGLSTNVVFVSCFLICRSSILQYSFSSVQVLFSIQMPSQQLFDGF